MTYNDQSLKVGYIQELLKSSYIPSRRVLSAEKAKSLSLSSYIQKDGNQLFFVSNDNKMLITKNERIRSVTDNYESHKINYDYGLHKRLGEYLRFKRDAFGVDLMPLYNCFSGQVISDSDYSYYECFVRYGETYKVLCDFSGGSAYVFCEKTKFGKVIGDYSKAFEWKALKAHTGRFVELKSDDLSNTNIKRDSELRLYIRLPKGVTSSVSVVEYAGDIDGDIVKRDSISPLSDEIGAVMPNPSRLSLLRGVESSSKPFADRLFEYLLGAVLTQEYDISSNVVDATDIIIKAYCRMNGDISVNSDKAKKFEEALCESGTKGHWTVRMSIILKELICKCVGKSFDYDEFDDELWYWDKSVEGFMKSYCGNKED